MAGKIINHLNNQGRKCCVVLGKLKRFEVSIPFCLLIYTYTIIMSQTRDEEF